MIYNKVINNPIYKNKQSDNIDKKLKNLNMYKTYTYKALLKKKS